MADMNYVLLEEKGGDKRGEEKGEEGEEGGRERGEAYRIVIREGVV